MGNHQGGVVSGHLPQRLLYRLFCLGIQGGGRLIEDQDLWSFQHRPGNRNPLFLTAGEFSPRSPTTVW